MTKSLIIKTLLSIILSLYLLTGCLFIKEYKSDFIKTYNSYLKYSLGEYTVVDKQELSDSSSGPIPDAWNYIKWTLSYKDTKGSDRVLEVDNIYNKSKDQSMSYQIYKQANKICSDEIGNNICSNYFDYIADVNNTPKENLPVTYCCVEGVIDDISDSTYSKSINKKHGLKLSSITVKELVEKWETSFTITIFTAETEQQQLSTILEKSKSLLKDYTEYLKIETATANVESPYSNLYKLTYKSKKAILDIEDFREETTKQSGENKTSISDNYKDGHIPYIKNYLVNGKKLGWLDETFYDKESKKYYIKPYMNLIKALGIKVESDKWNIHNSWKIGDDIFKMNSYPGDQIIKNDETIQQGYFDEVSTKLFEEISNTTVVIDENKKIVIINSK